jgi:hypothetical protein
MPQITSSGTFNIDLDPNMVNIVKRLNEDPGPRRMWTGELVYSKKQAPLGQIRLHIPQSSTRITKLPVFSSERLCIAKMISSQYLNKRWFSPTANPSKKPECLLVEFLDKDAQKTLVHALRITDSAGLVFEETCTLLFFFKPNERVRILFNGDGSIAQNPIGVALLDPIKLPATSSQIYPGDEVSSYNRAL